MAKIVFFEIEDWEIAYLKTKLPQNQNCFFVHEPLTQSNVDTWKDADVVSPFIYSNCTYELLQKFSNLTLIASRSTGIDHIDNQACTQQQILVANVPTYGENTVAEQAFALLLAISRKIVQAVVRTRKGNFEVEGLRGFDLKEKSLGIVGMGHIGQFMARMATGFGMKVYAYMRKPDEKLASEMGFKCLGFDDLISSCDVISLHLPLTPETKHIINKNNILKFKKGSVLINTSRGGLVETEALVMALEQGIFSAVGLDVLEEEGMIKEDHQLLTKRWDSEDIKNDLYNHVLLTYDNVLITPHNAFNTTEALKRILDTTASNITNFLKNNPQNIVTPL